MIAGIAAIVAVAALAAPSATPPAACFDAVIAARYLRQIPTPLPDCGADCIVMSWPWFVDLDIRKVIRGVAPAGPLRVLSVQHGAFVGGRTFRLLLRRNTDGGWNLDRGRERDAQQCPLDAAPAAPYIRGRPGRTLDDLFRESVEAWDATTEGSPG